MDHDKELHFLCGFIICILTGWQNVWLGLVLAVLAGAAKELYDYCHQERHTVEIADFCFTAAGGFFGGAVLQAYELITKLLKLF